MKSSIYFTVLFLFFGLTITSCKKQGCTDTFADNYDSSAEEDDGSCGYSMNMVFWFNDARATHYDDAGALSPMHVKVNGVDVGEVNWFTTFANAPSCGTVGGTVNYKHSMTEHFEDVQIEYVDQMGNSFGTTTVNVAISEGDCKAILF